jgi:UDP-2-acetamido-2-deoxy-ribo-hexuluronate aminotransferase
MNIDFANLQLQYQKYKLDIDTKIHSVLNKSNYIMGEEIVELERSLEKFTGSKYAITCSSGTDALLLAMMAMEINPGDEIITSPFTFISSAETISFIKAKPIFVDIESDTFNINVNLIEAAITKKTKAIMPVSLFGQPADMDAIYSIAKKYNLKVIVDGAQSFGSIYKNKTDSNHGDISCTSFFPAKPLGCYGDGGAIFTNDEGYAKKIKMLRVHGQNKRYYHKYIGMGGRMDTMQAAILLAKIPYYKEELQRRNNLALSYSSSLEGLIETPTIKLNRTSAWAQYTVRVNNRDIIRDKLKSVGIPTAVYYPLPLHLQECFSYLNYTKNDFPVSQKAAKEVMSIPMNAFFSDTEVDYIIEKLKKNLK